jgi:hypothetical protein
MFNEDGQVRRLPAASLFIALLFPVLLPLLVHANSQADPRVPACCRRDGKHHCGMTESEANQPEKNFRQAHSSCPYRTAFLTVSHSVGLYPPATARLYAALISHPAIHAQVTANLLVAASRSHQKRGPPSVINS